MPHKPSPLPDSFGPLEMALDAERGDPAPDSPARTLLHKHNTLADEDIRHRRLQIASERAGFALKVLTGLGGFAAALALGSMAWAAHNAHGLVVEPFSVPPDLTARGLTGQVAAARRLDKLSTMQGQTNSERAAESYANNWAGDVKVEIPSTGVSIGELQKFLRQWLGHETRVSGDIVRLGDGRLAVTARVGDAPGATFVDAEANLDGLTQQAAEAVFAASQPYRYGVWLGENGQGEKGSAYFRGLIAALPPGVERSWDLAGLSQNLFNGGDLPGAVAAARQATADDPASPLGYLVLAEIMDAAGQAQAAYGDNRRGLALLRSGAGAITANARAAQILSAGAAVAEAVGDFRAAEDDNIRIAVLPDYNGQPHQGLYNRVFDLASRHDLAGARRLLATLPSRKSPSGVLDSGDDILFAFQALRLADLSEDGRGGLAAAAGLNPDTVVWNVYWTTSVLPLKALALARTGDLPAARALIATTPADCYPCQLSRAKIDSIANGNFNSSFAEAARLAPSLPVAEAAWAKALLDHGDIAHVLIHARRATALAPRFADPLEYWGEALLRQGDAKAAEAKFRQADALAPRWGANHMHWGEALMRQGRAAEARAQWLAARGMDLTPGERVWLDRLLAKGG